MDLTDYTAQLAALLPPGAAWTLESGSLGHLLRGVAVELARVDTRAWDLVEEVDPRTTLELLPDWERVCGLPDACAGQSDTLQQRRAAVVAKVTGRGGQSRRFYVDLAAALGYKISITEFRPFRAGGSKVGDPLTNGPWVYAWLVEAPAVTTTPFRAGLSAAGEPLRAWGNDLLECAISRAAPAHTLPLFGYQG